MTCSGDVWPDIKPIKNYLSKQSSVEQKPAWQEFEREGGRKLGRASTREGEGRRGPSVVLRFFFFIVLE